VISICPPFVISKKQIDRMVDVLSGAIAKVAKQLKAGVRSGA
jgi:adenosylmethionine-8-amino-7-oxononanoate aminotransferase